MLSQEVLQRINFKISLGKRTIGYKILFPDISFCTDNAAMISFLGEIKFNSGFSSNINFGAEPNLQMV